MPVPNPRSRHGRRGARLARVVSLRAACEPLERRALLSLAPAGAEFRANTFTTSDQSVPAIAADADGDFVVVWDSFGQDGSDRGIYAQRYNAAGVAQGSEFRVNTFTTGAQRFPAVAMDADGDFVVAWDSFAQDGSGFGIVARRFSAAGAPIGAEFRVNTFTTGEQSVPAVAMAVAGDFIVTWKGNGPGDAYGVYARRYNALGAAQGGEFLVNTFTTDTQRDPSVAMDADGDVVIAWTSPNQDGGGNGVYAQRFDALGVRQGGEFRVNTTTAGNEKSPSVAMDAAGDFVVAWTGSYDIFAQRYNAAGVAQGGEFRANTITAGLQDGAAAAMDGDGDFVITWSDGLFGAGQDGSGAGVFAQSFNAAGVPQGSEFRVNTFTTGNQAIPSVSMNADGDAVVAWHSSVQEGPGSGTGVYAQRYAESNPDTAAPTVGGMFLNGRLVTPYTNHERPLSQIVVAFSENVSDAGGPTGPNSVTNPANWLVTRDGNDVTSLLTITYGFNPAANRFEATLNLPDAPGLNFLLKSRDNVRDIAGNRLDGNLDGAAGGAMLLPFSASGFGPLGGEFPVSTGAAFAGAKVATDAAGNFVVVWTGVSDGDQSGVFAQRYDAAGARLGAEFRVNSTTTRSQNAPSVGMDSDGDFVVTWASGQQALMLYGVYAQRFNASGVPQGGEFRVNTVTTLLQLHPAVTVDPDGDFVVAWSGTHEGSYDVYARRYDAQGLPQGGEFRVNTFTSNIQRARGVASDAAGNFVVVWQSFPQDGSDTGIYGQRFNAAGVRQGGEFRANTFTTGHQPEAAVAMGADGSFVVTWQSDVQDPGGSSGIYAQRYNAAGLPQGGEFRANTFTTGDQEEPAVAVDRAGNFVVTWNSDGQDGSVLGVYAQRYSAAGVPLGSEFRVNTTTADFQRRPGVASDPEGNVVIAWGNSPSGGSIDAQRYGLRATPTVEALSDTPDPVTGGNSITLSASGVRADGGAVQRVSFYRESNGEPGLQVGFEGDTHVGTATTEVGGFWSASALTTGLTPGTYAYWAQATDDAGLSGAPASTTNTVIGGTAAPVVTASQFRFATAPQRLTFTFDQNVGASLGLDDIEVRQLPGGPTVAPSALGYDPSTNTATFTFNVPLPDGRYRARLIAAGISGPGGALPADHTFEFTFLRGDANGDGRVNLFDFNILAANFGQSNRDFTQGDFDYSGNVNLNDFNILASRFGQAVAPQAGSSNGRDSGSLFDDDDDDDADLDGGGAPPIV